MTPSTSTKAWRPRFVEKNGRVYVGRAPSDVTIASFATFTQHTKGPPAAGEKRSREDREEVVHNDPTITSLKYGWGCTMKPVPEFRDFVNRVVAYMAQYEHWASLSFTRALWDAATCVEPIDLATATTLSRMLRLPWAKTNKLSWAESTRNWLIQCDMKSIIPQEFCRKDVDPGISKIRDAFHRHYIGLWDTYNQPHTLSSHIQQALRRLFPTWKKWIRKEVSDMLSHGKQDALDVLEAETCADDVPAMTVVPKSINKQFVIPTDEQVRCVRDAILPLQTAIKDGDSDKCKHALGRLQSCASRLRWGSVRKMKTTPPEAKHVVEVHTKLASVVRLLHPIPKNTVEAWDVLENMLESLDKIDTTQKSPVKTPLKTTKHPIQVDSVNKALQQLKVFAPAVADAFVVWCKHTQTAKTPTEKSHRRWYILILRTQLLKAMQGVEEPDAPGKLFTIAPIINTSRPFIRINNSWVQQNLHAQNKDLLGMSNKNKAYGVVGLMNCRDTPIDAQVSWSTTSGESLAKNPTDKVPRVWTRSYKLPRSIVTDGVSVIINWERNSHAQKNIDYVLHSGKDAVSIRPDNMAGYVGDTMRKAVNMGAALAQVLDPEIQAKVAALAGITSRQFPPGVAVLAATAALYPRDQWCTAPYKSGHIWLNLAQNDPSGDSIPGIQRAVRLFSARNTLSPSSNDPDWLTAELWTRVLQAAQALRLAKPSGVTTWLEVNAIDTGARVTLMSGTENDLLCDNITAPDTYLHEYVVAADPGEVHLFAAVDGQGHSLCKYSKRQYYEGIGATQARVKAPETYVNMPRRKRIANGWAPDDVLVAQAELTKHSLAASDVKTFENATINQAPHRMKINTFYGSMWHARCRFHRFKRKQRTLQKIVDMLAPQHPVTGERPLLLMGAGYAGRRQAMKGSALGPSGLMGIMEHVRKHVRVAYIDEYNTSQTCHTCHSKMIPLTMASRSCGNGKIKSSKTAGKHCPHCRRDVPRDVNAACNILNVGLAQVRGQPRRPEYLRRPSRVS